MNEVVTNQLDLLADEEVANIPRPQQLHLVSARGQQAGMGLYELVVQVAGMNHQLGDAGAQTPKRRLE